MTFLRVCPFFFLAGAFLFTMPTIAQTRTNTKKLSQELQQKASELKSKAQAAQAAVDAARLKIAENDQAIAALGRERQKIRDEKARLLGEVVWDIMNDPKIGQLARANPQRVRNIPAIQEVLQNNPWIEPVLDEILKDYQ